jgi:transcriptional regulator with XRE-family HTH domain
MLVWFWAEGYIMVNMQEPKRQSPFRTLGKHLKILRENQRKSLAEVSGAVEIDSEVLERIESGDERPSEDLLMLLVSYFDLQDHEAVKLWDSAGYAKGFKEQFHSLDDPQTKIATILLAVDVRAMYSDGVVVTGNESGVIMSFLQRAEQEQPLPVARIGMSYTQAEEVLRVLEIALLRSKYTPNKLLLPPGKSE